MLPSALGPGVGAAGLRLSRRPERNWWVDTERRRAAVRPQLAAAAAGAAQLSAVIPPYQYNTRAAAAAGPTLPDTRLHMRALKNINLTVGCEYKEFFISDTNVQNDIHIHNIQRRRELVEILTSTLALKESQITQNGFFVVHV